jgi:hypothetical protein
VVFAAAIGTSRRPTRDKRPADRGGGQPGNL